MVVAGKIAEASPRWILPAGLARMERIILSGLPKNTNNKWAEIGSEMVQLLAVQSSAVLRPWFFFSCWWRVQHQESLASNLN